MRFIGQIGQWVRHGIDSGAAFLIQHYWQKHWKGYGDMQELLIDSKEKKVRLNLLLRGETAPLIVQIDEYEIAREPDATRLLVKKASASREWIDLLLREFVIGKPFVVPEEYAKYLKIVL